MPRTRLFGSSLTLYFAAHSVPDEVMDMANRGVVGNGLGVGGRPILLGDGDLFDNRHNRQNKSKRAGGVKGMGKKGKKRGKRV